ncbi:SNP47 protein, partial [Grantiella picta]|nr:SNP47 protein [Grantiella picta]
MNEAIRIHSWPCSYYLDTSKQWIPGKLSLTPVSIKFTADRTGELLLDFHLAGISEIKKESSQLIFSSLTVLEKGTKHWFSSLRPNRNVVFNVLEHFWREQLISREEGAAGAALESSKGRELSGMLVGSQKRLEDTAKVLHCQGEQFDNILKGLHRIEGDMDVADSSTVEKENPCWILGASTWNLECFLWEFGAGSKGKGGSGKRGGKGLGSGDGLAGMGISRKRACINPIPSIPAGILGVFPMDCEDFGVFPVDFQEKVGFDKSNSFHPSWMCFSQWIVRILEFSQWIVRILEFSQWIVRILEFSQWILRRNWSLSRTCINPIPSIPAGWVFPMDFEATGLLGGVVNPGSPLGSREGMENEVQLQKHEKVSQEEAKELRQILKKLKGLALETEAELERQDEALDSISSSVDRATLSIDRQNRRMRKLT